MPAEPCCYRRGFLPLDDSERLCRELLETVCWREEWLHLYGRRVRVPRLIAWYGDPGLNYRYAGRDHHTTGWPARLTEVRDRLTAVLGPTFNFVLLNRYRDGDDHMGWHTDDERGHGHRVASVSLGATRRFLVRAGGETRSRRYDLEAGSLLVLDGRCPHRLPPTRRPVGERINLTFRQVTGT